MFQSIVATIFLDLVHYQERCKVYRVQFTEYSSQSTVYKSTAYRVQLADYNFTEYSLQGTNLLNLFIFATAKYGLTQFNVEENKC